ncbi:hypothetical protein SL054_001974 [Flavobacterium psychrophilum]|uniref:DUF6712 family protein n=1 Tax=Flavobacterium psychrophilum TaxID=96345 RepID=UPI000A3C944A|nr:DUF6712 family protein [Flavobacterium psychrophilum]EKT3974024.1 hypothetical protein [Flavobacterium psychrophilum]EKT4497691.1 hypothetical protein [Flavobacterium psychrophilum]EKT4549116.1 hypothetical protein [Flavobacterium psychrophilum]ELY1992624.1 hypothetical protein [Flavobacterium psychrophilum]OUD30257.1 hypothetical protein FPG1W08_08600 [Flavobacterium psychrophilum]
MELLFNKNGAGGSTEIKEILGFTDANLKFITLKPKLIPATDTIIELIGKPLYDSLIGIYNAPSQSASDKEFLNRVQYIILLDGYRNLAMDTDLGHTNNGRVNRIEDKQKIAFEWQIVNSNRKMERDYYRALDSLIKYMDKNVSGWKATDAFKQTHDLFIRTAAEIDDYFNIDGSRLLFMKIAPGIRKAEREEIIPRITKVRFDELKTKLKTNTGDEDSILLIKIREAIVYKALSWAIPRLSTQLFPEGFLEAADSSRMTISARKSVEKTQAEAMSQRFDRDARDAYIQIENYIKSLTKVSFQEVQPIKPSFNPTDNFVDC